MTESRDVMAKLKESEAELVTVQNQMAKALSAGDSAKYGQLKRRAEDLQDIIPVLRDQVGIGDLEAELSEEESQHDKLTGDLKQALDAEEDAAAHVEAANRLQEECRGTTKALRSSQEACSKRLQEIRLRISDLERNLQDKTRPANISR